MENEPTVAFWSFVLKSITSGSQVWTTPAKAAGCDGRSGGADARWPCKAQHAHWRETHHTLLGNISVFDARERDSEYRDLTGRNSPKD